MAKRRTKEQVARNEKRLETLFNEHTENGRTAVVDYMDLRNSGYEGSFPYCTPNSQGIYGIKQMPSKRGAGMFNKEYSIFILI